MRVHSLVLAAALAGASACAGPHQSEHPSEHPTAHPVPSTEWQVMRSSTPRECRTTEGALLDVHAPLSEVMRQVINPSLTRVSWLLFHDPRPADTDAHTQELAQAAETLARCFVVIPGHEKPATWTEFDVLAVLQAHNAIALADAALQNDPVSQRHWYLHIKETCQSCHEQYRFKGGAGAREDAR